MLKKLYYIANVRIPTEKAHGFQIIKACEAFANQGVNVELWVPTRSTPIHDDPYEFYGVKRNFLIKKIRSIDISFLYKHGGQLAFWAQSFLFMIALVSQRISTDVVIYTRNAEIAWLLSARGYRMVFEAHYWPGRKHWLYKFLLKRVAYIVCNSKGTEIEYLKKGFLNVMSVQNGVDANIFLKNIEKSEAREKLSLPDDKQIITYTGHLYDWKGVNVVLEAANGMLSNKKILFAIIGGTTEDVRRYEKSIKKRGLSNVFLAGYKKHSLIPYYLAASDVLLLPNVPISSESEFYTSPIKMFEYMASGRPIVASDLPSTREVLNEENSILAKAGDAQDLIRGINQLLMNPALSDALAEKARFDVKEYTWDKRAIKILNFINNEFPHKST